jgi:dihydrofolate reductase
MARLIYSAAASLDGYVADRDGKWDWSRPDDEVHSFINDLQRPLRAHLYGRRMYEVLSAWEDLDLSDEPGYIAEFAEIWRSTDKIVFSRTLQDVSTSRTRLERNFDPETIRELKASAQTDLVVGGPELAGQAMQAGLVDEIHLFLAPAVVGGGKRAISEGLRLDLELLEQRRFRNGTVYLRYRA